ncbi:MAG TPA: RNA-binding protein [Planctomycetaceae bacterium]|nr:RNA-binding protein [Planctomycetaceae bacterium]HIQ22440.1 RNA-binding protein [Planctomycetota bacterium]
MSKNLYVGNLSYTTTNEDLRQVFEELGTVTSVQIIMDRATGRSRGFGFVEMADGADEAISRLNGTDLQGRAITVNEARPRQNHPRGGRGGGRGYGF